MKKFYYGFLAVACALMISAAQAGTVRLGGDVGLLNPGITSGTIQVMLDLQPTHTLAGGGGVDFAIETGTPGVIEFTSAEIADGASVWDAVRSALVQNNGQRVQLNTTAFFSAGLPEGKQNHVLATINYNVLGGTGTALNYVLNEAGSMFDGNDPAPNGDVTSQYTFEVGAISLIPEPGTLVMAGVGLIGLVLRRRNG